MMNCRWLLVVLIFGCLKIPALADMTKGALNGERYRVIVSSDIGGGDEDDDQSFVHYLLYSDLFDTEGLISSPPKQGRLKDFFEVIDLYEKDYPNLKKHSETYPTPEYLRSIAKQGATSAPEKPGYGQPTDGSNWIIHCAKKTDPRPLYILVWGGIADVAQALHDDPSIKEKIRVYYIASWNRLNDPNSFAYIEKHHPDLWIIQCETTFRGWYVGGYQDGVYNNKAFIDHFIKNSGALGDYYSSLKYNHIKMGDTPSVAYLLKGDPNDPTTPHWGGQFVQKPDSKQWWTDDPEPSVKEGNYPGAKTVNRWRKDYLDDWKVRLKRLVP